MHQAQKDYCARVKAAHPEFFTNRKVLDIGSLDVNGTNKPLFQGGVYVGVDVGSGPNVDFVSLAHEFDDNDGSYDMIISTECFEHDMFYEKSLKNIVRLLAPGGMFLFTCATTGRLEHGTRRQDMSAAPLLRHYGEWGDYYKNLTEKDVRDVIDVDGIFKVYSFEVNDKDHDLYFYGIKKSMAK